MNMQKYSNIHDYREFEKVIFILYKLQVIDIHICALLCNSIVWTDGLVEVS